MGAPFKRNAAGNVVDRKGNEVRVLADARPLLRQLKADGQFRVAIASTCDEPAWADECLDKVLVDPDDASAGVLRAFFDPELIHIYGASSKHVHLKAIAKTVGCQLGEMIFYDNQRNNITAAEQIGVFAVYTPHGVTRQIHESSLAKYAQWRAKQ